MLDLIPIYNACHCHREYTPSNTNAKFTQEILRNDFYAWIQMMFKTLKCLKMTHSTFVFTQYFESLWHVSIIYSINQRMNVEFLFNNNLNETTFYSTIFEISRLYVQIQIEMAVKSIKFHRITCLGKQYKYLVQLNRTT